MEQFNFYGKKVLQNLPLLGRIRMRIRIKLMRIHIAGQKTDGFGSLLSEWLCESPAGPSAQTSSHTRHRET